MAGGVELVGERLAALGQQIDEADLAALRGECADDRFTDARGTAGGRRTGISLRLG